MCQMMTTRNAISPSLLCASFDGRHDLAGQEPRHLDREEEHEAGRR